MASEKERRHGEVRQSLTQLDLYCHALNLLGQKLVAQTEKATGGAETALDNASLQLGRDALSLIENLGKHVDGDDVDLCRSTLSRVDLAIHKASRSKTPTLHMVNVWRLIEACEQLMNSIADKYGYERLFEGAGLETSDGEESRAEELAQLFEEYEKAMGERAQAPKPIGPPFSHGILRWRGNQLFYVERVEDGARWIELDPDYERSSITEDQDAVEICQARSIGGYPITLRLDLIVDENAVDDYLRSQEGSEYYVSEHQLVRERGSKRARRRR